ncbi:hypothetical protein L6164_036052 [Bauhinia variegata]|uniref:Uncharacterized protein n=1 Tax=Bauhinia variegata TaxID=167791 RepID=A0ACB9KFT6_BAUVA|nr:hypothetical protein L6164_036052 [Bauhinia variegata]
MVSNSGSPRAEVGEIDTRVPFQSVKAAVSLFGEVAVSRERRNNSLRKRSSENVLEKETQLLLAESELKKIRQKLESTENTKCKTLDEFDKAKVTLKDLTTKLTAVRESKQAAIEAAKHVKNKAKQLEEAKSLKAIGSEAWKLELERARKEYTTTISELDAAKKELTKIRHDFDTALEAKSAAFQEAGEAQQFENLNSEKFSELSKELVAVKLSIEDMKIASARAQEEQAKVMAEKEQQLNCYKAAQEETHMHLMSLKEEYDPEQTRELEMKLAEISAEIEDLQEKMKMAHASEMNTMKDITSEFHEATKTLQVIAEEEGSLKNLVASLKEELEKVKKEQAAEAVAANLTGELQNSKEQAGSVEGEDLDVHDEQSLKLQRLSLETEETNREAREMSRQAEELKKEAEAARIAAEEAEKRIELLLKEAEAAKAAEQKVIEEMKILSEIQGKAVVSNSESNQTIKLSTEEFKALTGKVKECQDMVEKAEAESMAQLEAINKRKEEADRKMEAKMKAIEEIRTAIDTAVKNAGMAESAKMAVEGELKKWRQENKVTAEASSQMLEHSHKSSKPISLHF